MKMTHARCADADEHLDEVGTGDREERHARFACDGAREQRLTGARRPVEKNALRDRRAERLELLRVLEELLDLLQLFDGLVDTGDVLEAHLRRVGRHALRARLPEAHHLRASTLHLVHQEDPEADQQDDRKERADERRPREAAGPLRVVRDVVLLEQLLEVELRLVGRVVHRRGRVVGRVGRRDRALARVELDLLDLRRVLRDVRAQCRVRFFARVMVLRDQRLAGEPHQQNDHDEREEGAAEEAIHNGSSIRVAKWIFVRLSA
jgi:hypothetical protein